MANNEERQKVFADILQDTMEGIGLFRKKNTFYRCSKANRYAFEVLAEFLPYGHLYDVTLGTGSNYAPLINYHTHLSMNIHVGIAEHSAILDEEIRKERQRMEEEKDLEILSAYLQKTILPAFVKHWAPLLSGITSLREYLKVEERLVEQCNEETYHIKDGAIGKPRWVILLWDQENALRLCQKTLAYNRNYIQKAQNDKGDTAYGRKTSVVAANKRMDAVLAMEKQIRSGSMEELLAEIAELDAQSTKACSEFFGEDRYANS